MAGSDLYTGTLDVIVLKALSGGSMHGYAIGSWIRKYSQEAMGVKEGVLYPALHRLERKQLVKARWGQSETGRRAKFYTLTGTGSKYLETEAKRLTDHSEAVLSLLSTSGR